MRILGSELFSYKRIVFGDLVARQFVLFEHKRLFGIIFFHFNGRRQDRFHTHAFNSLSVKFYGTYVEGILEDGVVRYERRDSVFKYFPKDRYHSINESTGCLTMLIQGSWDRTWKENIDGVENTLTWHRVKVD